VEHIASIFRVERAEQETNVKADGKQSLLEAVS
jgi:hypothetical protein